MVYRKTAGRTHETAYRRKRAAAHIVYGLDNVTPDRRARRRGQNEAQLRVPENERIALRSEWESLS